jgi:outer membrane protein TolC
MPRRVSFAFVLALAGGCSPAVTEVVHDVILPEQRSVDYRDPAQLPAAPVPTNFPPPRTVGDPRPGTPEWQLSLDEAIHIALVNAKVVRVLAGLSATSSGQTIYDAAITNATIDEQQARFDPVLSSKNTGSRTNTPQATFNVLDPTKAAFTSTPTDAYRGDLGLTKTNVLGGQWSLDWIENPTRFHGTNIVNSAGGAFNPFGGAFSQFPLNPQNLSSVELSYTQPLLQGSGLKVNLAPVVIARLDTERTFFQYKDSVQELVRGVIEAYWTLVQARTDVWARKIQVDQSKEAYERESARLKTGFADLSAVAQAKVTYSQFRANLIAAEATVLAREGAMRNLLGLPPEDDRRIVPVSAPTTLHLKPEWQPLIRLAEQRRPDIIELKLIVEADLQRVIQAQDLTRPKLDAVALYRWNFLDGNGPNGEHVSSTDTQQYTDWSIGLNFSVPLGLRQGRATVRERSLAAARDRANVEQGVHAAVHQLAATVRDLENNYEQYLAFRDTRAAAYENLQVQIEQFRARRNIYLNVLQALNDFGNAVSSEAGALVAYNVALGTLERQTGTILETHGLVFVEERNQFAGPIPGHPRYYATDQPAAGTPDRYPGTGQPGENSFDLRNPDPHETAPSPRPAAPPVLPPPQPKP